jgi:glutathione S-transferase
LASQAPHFVLREIGAQHELVLVDRSVGAHKTPEYLALNPHARIPTFTDGDLVLYEAAAICLHLADRHPHAQLIPAIGSDARSQLYKWLAFLTNTLQADLWHYYRPEFYVASEQQSAYRKTMDGHIVRHLGILDQALESRDFLIEDSASIVDFYLFMLGRWSMNVSRPARSFHNLKRFLDRFVDRRSVREVLEIEKVAAPYY